MPIRELMNTLFSSTTKDSKFDPTILDNYSINININIPRKRTPSLSKKISRLSSIHSNVSSISYYKRMAIQSNDLS